MKLMSKGDQLIGIGNKVGGLYLLDARAELPGQERSNYAASQKISWDQWHRRYSLGAIKLLNREQMVNGLTIDESTIPSRSCEACIAAKQAHRSFPKEAEHRSKVPGERTVSDVRVESIGRWKYHIFFMDDCTRKSTTILTGKEEE
jgi:hypothetical protein